MSQEYDVFADLYGNDNEEKAKFLETLKNHTVDTLSNISSDGEDFLPPSLQRKEKGRGKKDNPPPVKQVELSTTTTAAKKIRKSHSQPTEGVIQRTTNNQSTQPTNPAPVGNSRITRSKNVVARQTPSSTVTISTTKTAPSRAKNGRRGRSRGGVNEPDIVEPSNTISLTESLDVIGAMTRGQTRRSVMRARRNYFAEIAARSTNVDYVDLVSSPLPNIEGVIAVDSDGEDDGVELHSVETHNTSVLATLECSFDEDNPEVSVKIKWDSGTPEVFKLRKYQKFHDIFSKIAERENTPIDKLVFNIDNRIISASETPASINYKVYEFISGRALTHHFDTSDLKKKRDANVISLKIQSDLWPRKPLQVELSKTDKLRILYIKCAEELKKSAEEIVLSFNGDHLGFNETPEDFEFEGGEAIDLRVKKK
ncbi:DNA repair protein Rad60 [Bactrocera oleae]|uniref:DNA repair protein Rad60 n=1 Tax=Bactrocera oleae TaxID=104688 RepID=UPI00387E6F08